MDGLGGRPGLNVETVKLMECNLTPLNAGEVELRNRLVSEGCFEVPFSVRQGSLLRQILLS